MEPTIESSIDWEENGFSARAKTLMALPDGTVSGDRGRDEASSCCGGELARTERVQKHCRLRLQV